MKRMRSVVLLTGCLVLGTALTAVAQEPARVLGDTVPPPHWNERASSAPGAAAATPQYTVGPEHFLAVQLLLGTETGVRFQATFHQECDRAWVGELFLGGAGTTYGSSGLIGAGVRRHYALASGAFHDYLIVSPGLDLMLLDDRDDRARNWHEPVESVLFLAPSVDIAWLHDFAPRFGWELGLHLGIGIGLSGTDQDGEAAGGKFTPLFGVYTGLRF